jgi:hypothetical protein
VRVRARKTGHGALLPLTAELGTALADYLRRGRPDTPARQMFVLHWLRVGAPISPSIVRRAMDNALQRAGMDAPVRGANLLRHSLATDLLDRGASLREIAGLLGHASLATTRIYAAVDVVGRCTTCKNQDYGAALRSGIRAASETGHSLIGFCDADDHYDIESFGTLLAALQDRRQCLQLGIDQRHGLQRGVSTELSHEALHMRSDSMRGKM